MFLPRGLSARPTPRALLLGACTLLAATLACLAIAPGSSWAAPCTPPVTNPVACENSKPGTPPSDWRIDAAGDETIQGFATSMSVNKGDSISFKIKSETANYHIDILRLGYYGGNGARKIASNLSPTGPSTNQPDCLTNDATGLIDCGNWTVSRSWTVPSDAVSGVYIAHLVRNDTGGDSHIPFVVRDDSSQADVVVQTSDSTWQAYNKYGGNSLYRCTVACPPGDAQAYKAAYKVSYNRPFTTELDSPNSALFGGAEYSMIRFLEANGYDLSYVSGVDVHRRGHLLQNHNLFISSGHDEYWSATQRASMEAARDDGVNLAFFSGNEGFWKTRWEPSVDGATLDRTLVSYKDTHLAEDQRDPVEWTGTWLDSRFTTAAEGVIPANALTGQAFLVNSGTSDITVPAAYGRLRMWRNTDAADLASGQSLQLAPSTLGYEWDEDADNGFRPAGQFRLSSTTVTGLEVFTDYGSTTQLGGTATHHLTMYRAPSGARVFGAGTVQWAWGLSDWNPTQHPADQNMQQATVNLFADMGAQPDTLTAGLLSASPTSDTTAPTSTVTNPPASVSDGSKITITGTAADGGGGVVAGVEVSTDGGSTWHPATTGTTNWSYSWTAHGAPSTTIKTRAVDDSGNMETPGAGVSINVSCPCSIWTPDTAVPAADADGGDPSPVEVGVKFKTDSYGTVSGIRFYKAAANTGTHVGNLWTADGQRLAQATFTNETASGWQSVTFDTPVEVQPDTTYVASYYAPNGHYAATGSYFYRSPSPGPNGGAIVDSPPLHAIRNTGSTTNGVFAYGSSSTFPNNSFGAANYWVDVMFHSTPPPGQVTGVTAAEAGQSSANVTWSAPTGGGAPTSYRITPYIGSTPQTPVTVSGSPPATSKTITGLTTGTSYRFTVRAINPNGAGPESTQSNIVTPSGPVVPVAPTSVSAVGASQAARVSWTAPSSDGDSPITGQTVTPYVGGAAQDPVQVGPTATSTTISGLTNGTSYTFKVTATNAIGTSPPSQGSNAVTPRATIFDFATPTTVDAGDSSAVELGVKFRADLDGSVTGIRFYKAAANIGTHTGSLWTAGGQRLAQATFTAESDSGWQTVTFDNPVPVTANTTYVASYFAPNGHYSSTSSGLTAAVDNPPLRALGNAMSPNGVYAYGSSSTFPTNTWNATNYSVDVLFAPAPVPAPPTGVTATAGQGTAQVSWSPPASGGPITAYRITPYIGSTPQTAVTVTGSPPVTSRTINGLTAGAAYTFTVRASNASGFGEESAHSNSVSPSGAMAPSAPTAVSAQGDSKSAVVAWTAPADDGGSPLTGYTITPYDGTVAQAPVAVAASTTRTRITGLTNGTAYTFKVKATNAAGTSSDSAASDPVTPRASIFELATPAVADAGDSGSVVLGVKFRADVDGLVTGIRFHKATANTGTHIGSLWTAGGQLLEQATFAGETASGWQSVTFANPVPIAANTTYVASYLAPSGHYSVTGAAFASSPVDNPPLRALASPGNVNGVYAYSAGPVFPSNSWNATNYWVDVLFAPGS